MAFFDSLRKQFAQESSGASTRPPATSGTATGGQRATAPARAVAQVPAIRVRETPEQSRPNTQGQREVELQSSRSGEAELLPADGGDENFYQSRVRPNVEDASFVPATKNRNPLQNAPVENDLELDFSTLTVTSAQPGQYAASPEQRKLLCFLSDGRLLVAAGQDRYSSHVMSYITLLERHGIYHVAVQTRLATISAIYASAGGASTDKRKSSQDTKTKNTASAIMGEAAVLKASDIHLEVGESEAMLHFRIDGDLVKVRDYDREFGMSLIRTLYQVIANDSSGTFKEKERLDARIGKGTHLPKGLDGARLATTPSGDGNKIVARLLYSMSGASFDLCELGFDREHDDLMSELKELPIGLNIISGPTGSGKSTTLQRTLRGFIHETKGTKHVITCEDPIEYPIPGAVQTPVGAASFEAAIASCMRLDPDVLLIGEIRDLPSAQMALRAATTGHQVWTTLHANSALKVVSRLVNIGMEKDMLLDHAVTTGLISQRLIKKLCPHCKAPLHTREQNYKKSEIQRMRTLFQGQYENIHVTGEGCEHCRKGTAGRTVVVEIVRPDVNLFEILKKDLTGVGAEKYWLNDLGGKTLMQHGVDKVAAGIADPFAAAAMLGPLVSDAEKYGRSTDNLKG